MAFDREVTGVYTRVTISSGEGQGRIRQAVLVLDCWAMPDKPPSLAAMGIALDALTKWVIEHHPDRKDWCMMPVERMLRFGKKIRKKKIGKEVAA